MEKPNTERIARAKAASLRRRLRSLGLVLKASVVHRRFRCGKPGCRCAKGSLHQDYVVTRKAGAKTQTVRVRNGREKEALQWRENWRRMKRLLDELTSIEIEILSRNCGTKRKPRRTKKRLAIPQSRDRSKLNAQRG